MDDIRGRRVFIDTSIFVYFIERDPKYLNTVKPVFLDVAREH